MAYMQEVDDGFREFHERMVVFKYQNYKFIINEDNKIHGIKCMKCDHVSYEPSDVDDQYCSKCKIYHLTPN